MATVYVYLILMSATLLLASMNSVPRLHPLMVVVSRGLQCLELFWYRGSGLPLASASSQYMVQEHGTGCRLHFDHQDLAFTHSSVS